MKQIILTIVFSINFLLASQLYDPNDKSFKDGFYAGIKALEFQAKVDGFQSKAIKINKPYLLIFETKNTPLPEALFLQIISSREGYETHLTKNFITFGEYDREIDAKEVAKQLYEKFKIKAKVLRDSKSIITYPFLWDEFYSNLLNEAKQSGVIVNTKTIEIIKTINSQKPVTKKSPLKEQYFTFKNNKSMSYAVNGNESDSKDYRELGLIQGKRYKFDKLVKTNQGEHFVKAKNENLYFSIHDVMVEGKQ